MPGDHMKFRKRYEFKPDPGEQSILSQLWLTKKQRHTLLKWVLYSLLLLLLSLVQDVVLIRFPVMDATAELMVSGMLVISLLQTPESGGIFTLIGSVLFFFSGSAPGAHSIVLLTFLSVLLNVLRHSLLSRRFRSVFVCAAAGVLIYEAAVFAIGLFLDQTHLARAGVFLTAALLGVATIPFVYPLAFFIGKIGGESWKD